MTKPTDYPDGFRYIPSSVRILSPDKQTVFVMSMSQRERDLRKCLVGWENVLDEDGKPIPFDRSTPEALERSLSQLPVCFREELEFQIEIINAGDYLKRLSRPRRWLLWIKRVLRRMRRRYS
jgi:hypothetical protein